MHTDIRRLHNVIDGSILSYRGCGRTYAICHKIAGYIKIEVPSIVCVLTRYDDIGYILPMLFKVFNDHEILWEYKRWIVKANITTIKFKSEEDFIKLRGEYPLVVYMRHWD